VKPVQDRLGGRWWQVDVDAAGVADGDHLADVRIPGDRRGQLADRGVVFGLANQPSQLTSEGGAFGSEGGQDLGQRPDRHRVLRPGIDVIKDCS
jgi:hypothetical protein